MGDFWPRYRRNSRKQEKTGRKGGNRRKQRKKEKEEKTGEKCADDNLIIKSSCCIAFSQKYSQSPAHSTERHLQRRYRYHIHKGDKVMIPERLFLLLAKPLLTHPENGQSDFQPESVFRAQDQFPG